MLTIKTKATEQLYKQRFLSENNSLLRNLKNRVLDENKKNKLKRITKILHQLDFNCWFYCNEPVYQICRKDIYEYVVNKFTISEDKYQNILKTYSFHKVYKTIMELENFCVHRTLINYPFLELNEFYWKEQIFYSKQIPICLIIQENKEGPTHCERCKLKLTKYNYLQEYCSNCRHTLENKYYKDKSSNIQSYFKTYNFTKKVEYITTSTYSNISVLPNSCLDFPKYYDVTHNSSEYKMFDYKSIYTIYENANNPYKIITYEHDTDIDDNDESQNVNVSDTILEFINSINRLFRKTSTTSFENSEKVKV